MKITLLLLSFFLLENSYLKAQSLFGLDKTFANNGIYVGDTGGFARMVVQLDKKIIVTGGETINGQNIYVVRRFNEDGTIDASFANNGLFRPDGLGFNFVSTLPACLQPDGKILIGGSADTGVTNGDFLLIRLKQDGSLDSSFGGGGYIIPAYFTSTTTAIYETIRSIAFQPDGKILAYGLINFGDDTLQVMRFQANGEIDSSFGINGRAKLFYGFHYPTPNDIALLPDGRIVVGADAKMDALNGARAFLSIRLLSDGNLDTSFNHTGLGYTNNNLPGLIYCKAMNQQVDGKVLLAGYADSLAIVRLDASGQLDNSFGKGGIAKIEGGFTIRNATMHLQSDGKILLSAQIDTANYLFRIQPDGSLDNSFGLNGKLIIYGFSIGAITTQQNAHILAAGMLTRKTAIMRLTPNATNVPKVSTTYEVTIYPNPASEYLYIHNPTAYELSQVMLYSSIGKLVLTQSHPNTNRLSTESLADGMYYLKLSLSNHQQVIKKIIIQKND